MKHSLQLKLSQHLTLTPQLQQSIKLLQLSTVELNQELERYLTDNPLLERVDIPGDDVPLGMNPGASAASSSSQTTSQANGAADGDPANGHDHSSNEHVDYGMGDDGIGMIRGRSGGDDGEDNEFSHIPAAEPTLQEHLLQQLQLIPLPRRDKELAGLVIAHLDEDGYCTQDLAELHAMVCEELDDVEPEDLSIALKHVQNLEPTGVGARNLAECLTLQLKALPDDLPGRDLALKLASHHLDALAARDFNKLKRLLSCDEMALKQVRELILTLDPKPGRNFGQGDVRYVVPDVLVKKVQGKWTATLNQDAMPKLRINKFYADILQASRDASGKNLAGQLQEARWLIKNVQQRFDTILRVTQAIVDRQRHFFEHGEVAMRPLVLREIADQVGLHESTISRVTTQKYMLTSRGLFELKYFFGSSVSTDTGGACSATAIRALIKQLVHAEDGKKPLSDNRISDILAQQGIVVARRTVAKYREAMQIQPANLRKSL
ncbi:MAG: RNA polymerase factor sigma-54 [Betaproteobacteria bacterium]|nr:RNA polymerase factor sigma-54 [Betaproteobacteria bacterium]